MPTSPFVKHLSRWTIAAAVVGAAVFSGWIFPVSSRSQVPVTVTSNVALTGLLTQIKAQQDQMAANQTKIEAQTALLEEALRQAKIYGARAGSGHR